MFYYQGYKFYHYFNLAEADKDRVLTRNNIIRYGNILIARLQSNNRYVFCHLDTVKQFLDLYQKTPINERTYYAIIIGDYRYMYLDIDYKGWQKTCQVNKTQLISHILEMLRRFTHTFHIKYKIEPYPKSWYIWDATRKNKFSIHIINSRIILHYQKIHEFIKQFKSWMVRQNNISNNCQLDLNIYHRNYQLWRLPGCHNNKPDAILKYHQSSVLNKSLSIEQQMKLNFMSDISENKYNVHITNVEQNIKKHSYKSPKKNYKSQQNCIDNRWLYRTLNDYNVLSYISKICDKFELNMISNYKSTDLDLNVETDIVARMTEHICPIAKRAHGSNTSTIKFHNLLQENDHIKYIKYSCFGNGCENVFRYYTMNDLLKRPWMFKRMSNLDISIMVEIDTLIDLLFKRNIIKYTTSKRNHQVFKDIDKKLWKGRKEFVFTTFMHDNIIHTGCGESNMTVSYRKKTHPYANLAMGYVYCRSKHCGKYFDLNHEDLW